MSEPEPTRRPRWDPDERGIGVADARGHLATLDALRQVADEDGWVAEEPEKHLLPHLVEFARTAPDLGIESAVTAPDGTYEIVARWVGPADPDRRTVRAAAFVLVGVVAEGATVVHETRGADGAAIYEVVTGLLPEDTPFATHGHTVRVRVRPPDAGTGTSPDRPA